MRQSATYPGEPTRHTNLLTMPPFWAGLRLRIHAKGAPQPLWCPSPTADPVDHSKHARRWLLPWQGAPPQPPAARPQHKQG